MSASSDAMIIPSLAAAMNYRLKQMKHVAAYKMTNGLSIEDLAREEEVLFHAKKSAEISGLSPSSVGEFIQTQMDVGKIIQYRYCAEYIFTKQIKTQSSIEYVREKIMEADVEILNLISLKLYAGPGFSNFEKNKLIITLHEKHMEPLEKEYLASSILRVDRDLRDL
ncbi:chorismate mutase, putative [Serratia marcescens VGH107]|nr:chorismate mutase, putative [Serratia marcescens VGH107]